VGDVLFPSFDSRPSGDNLPVVIGNQSFDLTNNPLMGKSRVGIKPYK